MLYCAEPGCGIEVTEGNVICPHCGGLVDYLLSTIDVAADTLRKRFADRSTSHADIDRSGVWRYRELLPPIDSEAIVTLVENEIPLQTACKAAAWSNVERLSIYHCGRNPTGSFKDAGMTVAVSFARTRGATSLLCASTGNTSAAMAAYASRAGLHAYVLAPRGKVTQAKIAQTLAYGAQILTIDGDFDDCLKLARETTSYSSNVALVNSIDPYRIEGQKTVAYAMLQQRDWHVPDWIVLPGGNLGNVSALGKGFRDARDCGLIDRLPRLCVVQAVGAAPFVKAMESGGELEPVHAETVATAIRIGNPASWRKARRELQASGGIAIAVTDDELLEARRIIGSDGLGCEPASAASIAGLRALRKRGLVDAHTDTVAILTGNVLKDSSLESLAQVRDVASNAGAILEVLR